MRMRPALDKRDVGDGWNTESTNSEDLGGGEDKPPKNGLIALQTPRTRRLSSFYYCQVVNRALLKLLSTYILV